MNRQECTYQRTDAGRRAWADENSGLPPEYRNILGLVQEPMTADQLIKAMSKQPEELVLTWLDQLESLGFVAYSSTSLSTELYEPAFREVA